MWAGQQAAVRVRTVFGTILPGPVDAHHRPVHTHRPQAIQIQTRLVQDNVLGSLSAHRMSELNQYQGHRARSQNAR